MARLDEIPLRVQGLIDEIRIDLETNDLESICYRTEDVEDLHEWLTLDTFDRSAINRRLKQYATNGENWMWW